MQTDFDRTPLIPAPAISRAAGVSDTTVMRLIRQLEELGEIAPERTPTGRTNLSPADGRRLFDALRGGRPA